MPTSGASLPPKTGSLLSKVSSLMGLVTSKIMFQSQSCSYQSESQGYQAARSASREPMSLMNSRGKQTNSSMGKKIANYKKQHKYGIRGHLSWPKLKSLLLVMSTVL